MLSGSTVTAFDDVSVEDPDFAAIQCKLDMLLPKRNIQHYSKS